jgi:exodeoxyribonuclease V alpha subunit
MTIRVIVSSLLSSSQNGAICSARTATDGLIRVACRFPVDLVPGDVCEVAGTEAHYVDSHGRRWRQIEASSVERVAANGSLVEPYLARLPGLGPTRAQRLWRAYGENAIAAVMAPDRIEEVAAVIEPSRPTMGATIVARLCSALSANSARLESAKAKQSFLAELEAAGICDRKAADRLWELCGTLEWRTQVLRRPYLAAAHIPWRQADHLGMALLRQRGETSPADAPERLLGAVDSAFQEIFRRGDTAAAPNELAGLLKKRGVDAERALALHVAAGWSRIDRNLIRPKGMAWIEDSVAASLQARRGSVCAGQAEVTDAIKKASGLALTTEQAAAVERAVAERVWIITGGAGTGKTAAMAALCDAWETMGGEVEPTCISGKGALVLSRAASRIARTCAGFLEGLGRRARLEDEGKPIPDDLPYMGPTTMLIVDEASMLDTFTLHRLLTVLHPEAKLILVGDPGQLPPVSPGCVFHDLCRDGTLVSNLTTVMRQAADSAIPYIAAEIRAGRCPDLPNFECVRPGAFLVDCEGTQAQAVAAELHDRLLADDGPGDCLHLAARNITVAAINAERVARRPTGTVERRLGPLANVAVGDPVLCTRNRYGDNLRNGQLGRVLEIREADVVVAWDGHRQPAILSVEVAADVALAWGMTVHRAQGSSARRVIVRLEETPLVTREWLYTAATRAAETVVFVGPKSAMVEGASRRTKRLTGFPMSFETNKT